MASESISTFNKFAVAGMGDRITIMNPPRGQISADDALLLAAYLVCMAEHEASNEFNAVLEAVQNT